MQAKTIDARAPHFYDEPSNSLGYLTRITYRSFSRWLEKRTIPHGVSTGQWPFLRQLWIEEGLTQRELSRRVRMQEPTTVTALNSMEKSGLVRREPSTEDRRKVHVYLTPKARELREVLMVHVAQVNAIAAQGLDDVDVATLRRVLMTMIANLAEDEAGPPKALARAVDVKVELES